MNGAQLLVPFSGVLAFAALALVFTGWRAGRNELVVERLLGRQEAVAMWPRSSHWLTRQMRRVGIQRPRPRLFGAAVFALLLVWNGLRLFGIAGVLGDLLLTALSCRVALDMLYQRRLKRMIRQMPHLLDQAACSLCAGRTPDGVLMQAMENTKEPLHDIFTLACNHMLLGIHLPEALQEVTELYETGELCILALGVLVSHCYGSNTSDLLDSIVKPIHEREKLSRQLHTTTGETRISAYVLAGTPNAPGDYILVSNPGYLLNMWADGTGRFLLLVSLGLQLLGYYALRCIPKSVQEVAMQAQWLTFAALLIAVGGALLLLLQARNGSREQRLIERCLGVLANLGGSARWLADMAERMDDSPWMRRLQLMDSEACQLLQQAGWHGSRYRTPYPIPVFLTLLLFVLLVLLVKLLRAESEASYVVPLLFAADIGFLLPKRVLKHFAKARRALIADEMILLVQLTRILFDVGLTVEQTLRVVCLEGRGITPQLARELDPALTRTDSGIDLAEELDTLTQRLQVDPLNDCRGVLRQMLRQGDSACGTLLTLKQLFEDRRLITLQERVGKLSAKTGLVTTVLLFPALLIVLAGPGVIAITKTLGGLG